MNEPTTLERRELLSRCTVGMGALALADVMVRAGLASAAPANPLSPKQPHFPARAKRVIHIFANGGASQVDTFDPKPALEKHAGKRLPFHLKTERETSGGLPSPFKFKKHGQSGIEVSELFPHVASHVDDICVIRSMVTDLPNHAPGLMMMNCGDVRQPRPSLGSWVLYGLGSENDNLPGYVAMCPGDMPTLDVENWRSAFLPGVFQGTYFDTRAFFKKLDKKESTGLEALIDDIKNDKRSLADRARQLALLRRLNARHRRGREGDALIESRMQAFELAFRMQMNADDVLDISKEPKHITEMYGPEVQGRQLLLARRLLERGVRFVQVWHGAGQPWDSHAECAKGQSLHAKQCDQGIAALLEDLKQRGMLQDTLVIWGGEFGRTPTTEGNKGRDHNPYGFTMWLAGGGVRGGYTHGATDDFGFRAVDKPVHVHDLHATILHLLGFDHEKLTYRYAGRDFRLTDVHGRVVRDILA